jgi:hypothetical protein
METKRSSKPKPAAGPEPITGTAPAVRRELTPVQTLICDEIADMLIHGGHKEDTDCMVWAALLNMHRRHFGALYDTDKERDDRARETARCDYPDCTAELTMEWKRNKRPEQPNAEPKPAAERIRAQVIDTLREEFDWFLIKGTPEEHRLLLDILQDHEGCNHGRTALDELPLAQAFEYAIGGAAPEYLKVPRRMRKQVEHYIECLKAADMEDCKPAA